MISNIKQEFIEEFINEINSDNSNNLLPAIIKYKNAAEKRGIDFTKEEINYIFSKLAPSLNQNELAKAHKLINLL